MTIRMRRTLAILTTVALVSAGTAGLAYASGQDDHGATSKATKVFTLDPSAAKNNPEGVAWDHRSRTFFVGTTGSGAIYRGTLDDATLRPFITPDPGPPADSAVGMKVSDGKLYVAGGGTGSIYVYEISTGARLARFETGAGGFLNDLVVTRNGDVYVTDSFRPTLWHLTGDMVKARAGTPEAVPMGPDIVYTTGFNLNGIVARHGGRELIVVQTNAKSFFRIDIDAANTAARTITKIDAPALGGDGLLRDRGRLLVVTGDPATLTFLKLKRHDSRARVDKVRTDPTLVGPSTVARARNRYLVVNADFAKGTTPFTVSGLSRKGGHGDHH